MLEICFASCIFWQLLESLCLACGGTERGKVVALCVVFALVWRCNEVVFVTLWLSGAFE